MKLHLLILICLILHNHRQTAQGQPRYQVSSIPYQPLSSEPKPVSLPFDGIGHLHPHHPAREPEVLCPSCLDARLIQHYHIKGCTPVVLSQCKCPSRFKCPVDMPPSKPKNGKLNSRFMGFSDSPGIEGRSMKLTEEGDIKVNYVFFDTDTSENGKLPCSIFFIYCLGFFP